MFERIEIVSTNVDDAAAIAGRILKAECRSVCGVPANGRRRFADLPNDNLIHGKTKMNKN